jgi:nitrite reductase/ring-hydroxylating ferredoxin subunit
MLVEAGPGVRFEIGDGERTMPAFAVRYDGRARAYVNRCSHMGLQLDFKAGAFFDMEKRYIICATHGALYDPVSGACRAGPCNGTGLIALTVTETDGQVVLTSERYRLVSTEAFED